MRWFSTSATKPRPRPRTRTQRLTTPPSLQTAKRSPVAGIEKRKRKTKPIKAAVIMLHGIGQTGKGAWSLRKEELAHVKPEMEEYNVELKWMHPTAPVRTLDFAGTETTSWYNNTREFKLSSKEELLESCESIHARIDRHVRRRPSTHIFLGGFSQGSGLALYAGLSYHLPLGGILIYSGVSQSDEIVVHPANEKTPILWEHGLADPVVPFRKMEYQIKLLRQRGLHVDTHTHVGLGHEVAAKSYARFPGWIHGRLMATASAGLGEAAGN